MKRIRPLPLFAIGALSVAAPLALPAAPPEAAADGAVETEAKAETAKLLASVNGKAITTADVERTLRMRYGPQLDQMPAEQRAMAIAQAAPQMTEELIARALLLDAAKAVEVTPEELDEVVADIRGRLPQSMKFEDYLSAVGRKEEELRAELAEETKINKHLTERLAKLPSPSDEQIAAFYEGNKAQFMTEESVQASHILLKTDPGAGEAGKTQKLAEINTIRKELVEAGGDGFAEAAKEHSDCPSGQNGGALGNFGRGQMVAEFEQAAFTQKEGEIGEVVETQFGYHIIQVTGKTEAGQQAFEDVKESISNQLDAEQRQTAVQSYLEELEKSGKVERKTAAENAPESEASKESPAAPASDSPPEN